MDNVDFRMLLTVALLTLALGLAAGLALPGLRGTFAAIAASTAPSNTLHA